jgi:UDP-glucose 4-epimerase
MCEQILRDAANANYGWAVALLRYFNPIGAHPSAEIGELPIGIPQNLVPFLTQAAAGIRQELNVFGNDYDTPDGSCIRDYINVVDLAKAHVIAIERMLNNPSADNLEIFNLGTGNGISVLELIHTFEQATGVKVPHRIADRRDGDIEKVWADPELANKVLGWRAKETLADTLLSAWKWQKNDTFAATLTTEQLII